MSQSVSSKVTPVVSPRSERASQASGQFPLNESAPIAGNLSFGGRIRLRIDFGERLSGASASVNEFHFQAPFDSTVSLEEFVSRHGSHFDSYLATEPGRITFRSQSQQGLISYTQRGKHVIAGGGLIAPEVHKPELLDDFLKFLSQNKLRVAFHNIGEDELPLFRKHSFEITKWGEEPVIDLPGRTWGGKAFEWVRRQKQR